MLVDSPGFNQGTDAALLVVLKLSGKMEKHGEWRWSCVTGIRGQISQQSTSASLPHCGSRAGAVRADVSFHLPGCWFPCRGSKVVTALIKKEVLGRWLLVISEPLNADPTVSSLLS